MRRSCGTGCASTPSKRSGTAGSGYHRQEMMRLSSLDSPGSPSPCLALVILGAVFCSLQIPRRDLIVGGASWRYLPGCGPFIPQSSRELLPPADYLKDEPVGACLQRIRTASIAAWAFSRRLSRRKVALRWRPPRAASRAFVAAECRPRPGVRSTALEPRPIGRFDANDDCSGFSFWPFSRLAMVDPVLQRAAQV